MGEDVISPAVCAELRRAAARGTQLQQLATEYELGFEAVQRHVWGTCGHEIDVSPMPME